MKTILNRKTFVISFLLIIITYTTDDYIRFVDGRPIEEKETKKVEPESPSATKEGDSPPKVVTTLPPLESNVSVPITNNKKVGDDNNNTKSPTSMSKSSDSSSSSGSSGGGGGLAFEFVDLDQLDPKCSICPASEKYFLVCGSDGVVYRNIGVLWCAQRCNKDLKLKDFGPCEGAKKKVPQTTDTPLAETTTTLVNYHGIHVNPKTQVKIDLNENPEILETLKLRIKARIGNYTLPPKWKEWCLENKDKCYYGFDPSYNPALYLVPGEAYSAKDSWFKFHDKVVQQEDRKFSNGFTSTTSKPKKDEWF